MTLKGWEGTEHRTVNRKVSRHNSLDADNNEGNDDEEKKVQNRFNNDPSLESGGAQLQSSRINEICYFFGSTR
jgi:hypothetical protein